MRRRLAVLCPSRGRPECFNRMAQSALETSEGTVIGYVDSDDDKQSEYQTGERVIVDIRNPVGRGRAVNDLCDRHRDFDDYLVVSDDITFTRGGWGDDLSDAMKAFPNSIGVAHLPGTEPTHSEPRPWANWICLSRNWIDTLGWWNYPECTWFCQDTIVQVLGEALGKIIRIEPPAVYHYVMRTEDMGKKLAEDEDKFLWFMAAEFGNCLNKLRRAASE